MRGKRARNERQKEEDERGRVRVKAGVREIVGIREKAVSDIREP